MQVRSYLISDCKCIIVYRSEYANFISTVGGIQIFDRAVDSIKALTFHFKSKIQSLDSNHISHQICHKINLFSFQTSFHRSLLWYHEI